MLLRRDESSTARDARGQRRTSPALAVAALSLGALLALSAILTVGVALASGRGQQDRVERSAFAAGKAMNDRVKEIEVRLERRAASLPGLDAITPETFATTATTSDSEVTDLLPLGPDVLAISVVEEVAASELAGLVADVAERDLQIRVRQSGDTTQYVGTFSEGSNFLEGVDLAQGVTARQAFDQARDTDAVVFSDVIELPPTTRIRATHRRSAFLMVKRISGTGDNRTSWLAALVSGVGLLDGARQSSGNAVDLALIDDDETYLGSTALQANGEAIALPLVGNHVWISEFRQWNLVTVDPTGQPFLPAFVMAAGSMISVIFAAFVWSMARSRDGALGLAADEAASRRRSQRQFGALVQNLSDLIIVCDDEGTMGYVSPSVTKLVGKTSEELSDSPLRTILHPDDHDADLVRLPDGSSSELKIRSAEGDYRDYDVSLKDLRKDPAVAGLVLTGHDVTDRNKAEARLAFDATHDPLTGLPNRVLLLERLRAAIERSERHGTPVAVLFLDVDQFKVINDSLGHSAGDELLVQVAARIRQQARAADTVARFGGDEFILICEDIDSSAEAKLIAERTMAALAPPIRIGNRTTNISASVGVAVSGEHFSMTPEEMIRNADAAMYQAKNEGRGRVELFDVSLRSRAVHRLETESALHRALDQGELELHYQPIIDLDLGTMTGVEALIRWRDPVRGLVPACDFMPVAEESSLILDIDRWVFSEALEQAGRWQRAGCILPEGFMININVSARQINDPSFVDQVRAALRGRSFGDLPAAICLELTERVLASDATSVVDTLNGLKDLGIKLAIDDFGTGYSSLSYLRRFPVDVVKIDRSFVANLDVDNQDAGIVRAIVALTEYLDLQVIAEGVEEESQAHHLRRIGCVLAQGHLYGRPVPPVELAGMLRSGYRVRPLATV